MQEDFEVLLDLFAHIGLHPNVFKTKAMVSVGHRRPDFMSNVALNGVLILTVAPLIVPGSSRKYSALTAVMQ